MFETCEMKLESLSQVKKGPLLFEVIGTRQFCVDPSVQLDPWAFASYLRVSNTGTAPVSISYWEGALGNRAFSMAEITEYLTNQEPDRAEGSDGGPVDMSLANLAEQTLAQGAEQKVVGDPKYILRPLNDAQAGETLSGRPVPEADRWVRKYQITFNFWIKSEGMDVTGALKTPLEVVVKSPEE